MRFVLALSLFAALFLLQAEGRGDYIEFKEDFIANVTLSHFHSSTGSTRWWRGKIQNRASDKLFKFRGTFTKDKPSYFERQRIVFADFETTTQFKIVSNKCHLESTEDELNTDSGGLVYFNNPFSWFNPNALDTRLEKADGSNGSTIYFYRGAIGAGNPYELHVSKEKVPLLFIRRLDTLRGTHVFKMTFFAYEAVKPGKAVFNPPDFCPQPGEK